MARRPSTLASLRAEVARLEKLRDSWQNTQTGLNALGTDASRAHAFSPEPHVEPSVAVAMYQGDDLIARYCDALPFEALRRPTRLNLPGVRDDKKAELAKLLRTHCVREKLREAGSLGRVTGGGGVFITADDGRDPSEPLDLENLAAVLSLTVIDARCGWVEDWDEDPDSATYGEPLTYRIDLSAAGLAGYGTPKRTVDPIRRRRAPGSTLPTTRRGTILVHRTRLPTFGGAPTPRRERQEHLGWEDSVLRRFLPVLQSVLYEWQSAAHAIGNASQAVYKMHQFFEKVSTGRAAEVVEQLRLLNAVRQMRIMPVDAGHGESFDYVVNALTGVAEVIEKGWQRLGAATGWPITVLLGEAPAGLNATGEQQTQRWYDIVEDYQQSDLLDPIEVIVEAFLAAQDGPLRGAVPDGWSITFAPLYQQTDKEQADTQLVSAQADAMRLEQRVLTRRQVASRFTADGFSMGIAAATSEEQTALTAEESQTTLNGAQVAAMQETLRAASAGEIPLDSARQMLMLAFGLTDVQAKALIDPVQKLMDEKRAEAERVAAEQQAAAAQQAEAMAAQQAEQMSAREKAAAEDEQFARELEQRRLQRRAAA